MTYTDGTQKSGLWENVPSSPEFSTYMRFPLGGTGSRRSRPFPFYYGAIEWENCSPNLREKEACEVQHHPAPSVLLPEPAGIHLDRQHNPCGMIRAPKGERKSFPC